uniref:NADH-ubiquinone oxidoreductase chain 6 n=1 Tax=Polytomella capuana TaxID=351368 RepID=B0YN29_9CHLO|nr:NADH dehydrogenase subunit 6 [Polytomella capuana]ABV56561.1 NADH dehydrogenase subunit 6 [Polytomella capuana]
MLFYTALISALTALSLGIVLTTSPFMALMYSIVLYLDVQLILTMLGFEFMALVYALVYVGALAVLFLFVVMLIRVQAAAFLSLSTNVSMWVAGIIGFSADTTPRSWMIAGESLLNFGALLYTSYADLTILNSVALTVALFGSLV